MKSERFETVRRFFRRAAAPEGGAWAFSGARVRGCYMLILSATLAQAGDLPSGRSADLRDILLEQVGSETWARFRFVSDELDEDVAQAGSEEIETDMAALCSGHALPYLKENALEAEIVVISVSDRDVPFGESDPQAVQFFEAYRVSDGSCQWEPF